MKIYEGIKDKKLITKIKKNAKSLGLNIISSSKKYTLFKIGSKVPVHKRDLNRSLPVISGHPKVVGYKEGEEVWIEFLNFMNWFKTSPIISCHKTDNGNIEIETENSFYELVCCSDV